MDSHIKSSGSNVKAMDELMALTGLKKVKVAAVNLFKSAQVLERRDSEFR